MGKSRITLLILLTGLAVLLCAYLAAPFARPLAASAMLAVVFHPLHQHVVRIVRQPSVAAFLSTILVLLIVIVPPLFLSVALQRELADVYRSLKAHSAQDGGLWSWFAHQLERITFW
ncbi:MAG: hypothetical protein HOP19_16825, partial [Acidobacteria bacterium]|nr:hypothetical protein [Acidobacteriota bacterium]